MHADFTHETRLLQSTFATMGGISGAYVLGDALRGLQWHVFVAHSAAAAAWHKPVSVPTICSLYHLHAHRSFHMLALEVLSSMWLACRSTRLCTVPC